MPPFMYLKFFSYFMVLVKGEGSLRMSDSDAGLIPYRSVTPIKLGLKSNTLYSVNVMKSLFI